MSLRCVFRGSSEEPAEYVIDNPIHCVSCGAELDPDEDPGVGWEKSEYDGEIRCSGDCHSDHITEVEEEESEPVTEEIPDDCEYSISEAFRILFSAQCYIVWCGWQRDAFHIIGNAWEQVIENPSLTLRDVDAVTRTISDRWQYISTLQKEAVK